MTLVPANTRFIGFSELANLSENKTANLNAISQPFTMQDIADASGNYEVTDPFYENPNIKAKIITQNAAFTSSLDVDGNSQIFLELDINEYSSFIMQYSLFATDGNSKTGTYIFTSRTNSSFDVADFAIGVPSTYLYGFGIYGDDPNIKQFKIVGSGEGVQVEMLYSIKLFRLPLFYD
ncbi:MAG: hypothetical protein RIR01_2082 [Bacteroidota bacterium]|jgi:hypothetical protein